MPTRSASAGRTIATTPTTVVAKDLGVTNTTALVSTGVSGTSL